MMRSPRTLRAWPRIPYMAGRLGTFPASGSCRYPMIPSHGLPRAGGARERSLRRAAPRGSRCRSGTKTKLRIGRSVEHAAVCPARTEVRLDARRKLSKKSALLGYGLDLGASHRTAKRSGPASTRQPHQAARGTLPPGARHFVSLGDGPWVPPVAAGESRHAAQGARSLCVVEAASLGLHISVSVATLISCLTRVVSPVIPH